MSKYVPPCRSLERIACMQMEPFLPSVAWCSKCVNDSKRLVVASKTISSIQDNSSSDTVSSFGASSATCEMAEEIAKIRECLEELMLEKETSLSSSSSSNGTVLKNLSYSRESLMAAGQQLLSRGIGNLTCPKTKPPKLISELMDVNKIEWIRTRHPYKTVQFKTAGLSASDGNMYRGSSRGLRANATLSESQPHLSTTVNSGAGWRRESGSLFNEFLHTEASWRRKPAQNKIINIRDLPNQKSFKRSDQTKRGKVEVSPWRKPEM